MLTIEELDGGQVGNIHDIHSWKGGQDCMRILKYSVKRLVVAEGYTKKVAWSLLVYA